MLVLSEVTMEGFFCYKERVSFKFQRKGLVLIEGPNGSGKSTIFEAVLWALSGKTFKNTLADKVINMDSAQCIVTLDFSIGEDTYSVTRSRGTVSNLILKRNSEDISARTATLTQDYINKLIGVSLQAFMNTVILGEALSKKFTLLNDSERKGLIMEMSDCSIDVPKCLKLSKEELASKKYNLSIAQNVKDSLDNTIQSLLNDSKTVEDITSDILNVQDSLSKFSDELTSQQDTLLRLHEEKVQVTANNNKLANLTAIQTDTVRVIQSKISEYEQLQDSICPMCHSIINKEVTKTLKDTLMLSISEAKTKLQNIVAEISSMTFQNVEELNKSIESCNKEVQKLQDTVSNLTREETTLKSKLEIFSKIESLKLSSESKKKEIEVLLKEIKILEEVINIFSPTGITQYVLQNSVGYINSRLNVYSRSLLGREFSLVYKSKKIILKDSSNTEYTSLSSGEKKRLDISVQFALHDFLMMYTGMKVNVLLLDEVFESIDNSGIDIVISILKEKLSYNKLDSIYVITHNETLKDLFTQCISLSRNHTL